MSPPETVNTSPRDPAAASAPIRILLVEDDDGDALLVEELLAVSGAHVDIVRAQTLAGARREKQRHYPWMFTTLAMISIAPDRAAVTVRLAGHPPPLLLSGTGIEALEPAHVDPPLGVVDDPKWTAIEYRLPEQWSLLLYTDGLIEGRTGVGTGRLGGEGLEAMVRGLQDARVPGLVTALVERAEELNGGPMLDDVAAFLVQRR